jgi:hypothetical protein
MRLKIVADCASVFVKRAIASLFVLHDGNSPERRGFTRLPPTLRFLVPKTAYSQFPGKPLNRAASFPKVCTSVAAFLHFIMFENLLALLLKKVCILSKNKDFSPCDRIFKNLIKIGFAGSITILKNVQVLLQVKMLSLSSLCNYDQITYNLLQKEST